MKRFYLYTVSVALLFLSACSTDNDALPDASGDNTPPAALRIEVSASDFTPVGSTNTRTGGAPDTRATDNGSATTFESGDRIGITVLDASNQVLSDNIPYSYNGSAWSFDGSNGEGKTAIYYDNKATTYLAYFPYSKEADGVTDEAGLKAKFQPQYDQRTKAAYRASDLLVWSETVSSGTPSKTLAIAFTHAYASLSLSPSIKCTINGAETSYVPSSVSDVSFTIGTEPLLPYQASDGSFRIVVSPQETAPRWHYTYSTETFNGTISNTALSANTRYTLAPILNIGDYSLDKARVGDFYCKDAVSDNGYLIPGDAASLTDEQQKACVGIVYWVGNDASEDPLLQQLHSDCTHGLVAALHDVSDGTQWSSNGDDITENWLSKLANSPYGITSLKETNKMQGYANTKALDDYNQSDRVTDTPNRKVIPIDLIKGYATTHSAPANSSGWYWPSKKELQYMCWGQGASKQGTGGRDILKQQFEKVYGASSFALSLYWSSTEGNYYSSGGSAAWYVFFSDGYVHNYYESYTCRVRCALAF